jgi:hypothetical protein
MVTSNNKIKGKVIFVIKSQELRDQGSEQVMLPSGLTFYLTLQLKSEEITGLLPARQSASVFASATLLYI